MSLLLHVHLCCLSGECRYTELILECLPVFTRRRGLTFTSAHVFVPSTCRWARLSTHRHNGPHQVCSPCSLAHLGRATTACVSSPERRGSLHGLSHARHMQSGSACSTLTQFVFGPLLVVFQRLVLTEVLRVLPLTKLATIVQFRLKIFALAARHPQFSSGLIVFLLIGLGVKASWTMSEGMLPMLARLH